MKKIIFLFFIFISFSQNTFADINVNLNLRHEDKIIYSGVVSLTEGTSTISDSSSQEVVVNNQSTLLALIKAGDISKNFSISNLTYYPSFDSVIINCIKFNIDATTTSEGCYNWQYVVNGNYPYVGIDDFILNEGDLVYVYFGQPRRLTTATTSFEFGKNIETVGQKYNYENNTWEVLVGSNIGLIKDNPLDPYSPIVLGSTTTDSNGLAIFTANEVGNLKLGIADDYYYPSYQITVFESQKESTSTDSTDTNTENSGGGNSNPDSTNSFDIPKAISFLESKNQSGKYINDLYTDWVAIALASNKSNNSETEGYLSSKEINSNNLLDYIRRAMSLMSININPYTGTEINYIKKIIDAYDGEQIGDDDLINDDIFGLLVLGQAGYDSSDSIIKNSINNLLIRQKNTGEFESVDLTAAAVQTLSIFTNIDGVDDSISKARNFLKSSQEDDGGWGDTFATAWVIQAIDALGESPESWEVEENNPLDFLSKKQDEDGGTDKDLDDGSRVWGTSYSIPAVLKKNWTEIMKDYKKTENEDTETSSDEEDEDSKDLSQSNSENESLVKGIETEQIVPVNSFVQTVFKPAPFEKNISLVKEELEVALIDTKNENMNKEISVEKKQDNKVYFTIILLVFLGILSIIKIIKKS